MSSSSSSLAVYALAAALAVPTVSHGQELLTRNGVSFIASEVGADSRERLKAMEAKFNLKLVFTLIEGNYVADVDVTVKDARGSDLVRHSVPGPIFMARLPAGTYTVTVTYEGVTHTRKVKIGERLRTEYLRWPSRPDVDFPLPPEIRHER